MPADDRGDQEHRDVDRDQGEGDRTPPAPRRLQAAAAGAGARTEACPSRTHSGHWNPTEAGIMHSGQIGRPQRAQGMPVGRSGCR